MGTDHSLVTHQQFIIVDDQDTDGYTIPCGLPFMNAVSGIVNLRDRMFTATQDGVTSVSIPLYTGSQHSRYVNVIMSTSSDFDFTEDASFRSIKYGSDDLEFQVFLDYMNSTGHLDGYSPERALQKAQEIFYNLTPISSCCDDWEEHGQVDMRGLLDSELHDCMMIYVDHNTCQEKEKNSKVLTAAEFDLCFGTTSQPQIMTTAPLCDSMAAVDAGQTATAETAFCYNGGWTTGEHDAATRACEQQFAAYDASLKSNLVISEPRDFRLPEQQVGYVQVPGFDKPIAIRYETPKVIEEELINLLAEFPGAFARSLADLKEPARFPPMEIKL